MSNPRRWAVLVGLLFWVVLPTGLWAVVRSDRKAKSAERPSVQWQLWDYWTTPTQRLELKLPQVPARDGDPIFYQHANGEWSQVGFLTSTDSRQLANNATASWYSKDVDPFECRIEYHQNRGKFGDVVQMLLPPDKRHQLEVLIRKAVDENSSQITAALKPIIAKSLRESLPTIERGLKQSMHRHRDEIRLLGERYKQTVLKERLVPLVRDEVMPIVKENAEPLATQIGRELWNRASLWRFGWRALYDSAPLTNRDLLKREFDRFVKDEAIPVLESHTEDFLKVQRDIFVALFNNTRIRTELSDVAQDISNDQELRELISAMLRETFVDNPELRQVWTNNWTGAEAQAALKLAGERLEPVVRAIGDEIFGTRDGGISPSFARVLRNQILGKDKRWLVAIDSATNTSNIQGNPFVVAAVDDGSVFPLTILASPENQD